MEPYHEGAYQFLVYPEGSEAADCNSRQSSQRGIPSYKNHYYTHTCIGQHCCCPKYHCQSGMVLIGVHLNSTDRSGAFRVCVTHPSGVERRNRLALEPSFQALRRSWQLRQADKTKQTCIYVCLACGLTNGLRVSTGHVGIGDCYLAGLERLFLS